MSPPCTPAPTRQHVWVCEGEGSPRSLSVNSQGYSPLATTGHMAEPHLRGWKCKQPQSGRTGPCAGARAAPAPGGGLKSRNQGPCVCEYVYLCACVPKYMHIGVCMHTCQGVHVGACVCIYACKG